jgi:hypothetical protein
MRPTSRALAFVPDKLQLEIGDRSALAIPYNSLSKSELLGATT